MNTEYTYQFPLKNFNPFVGFLCGIGVAEKRSVWHDNPTSKDKT